MKSALILVILMLGSLNLSSAKACDSSVDGTQTECGSNWIRFIQGRESFRRYSNFGKKGFVKKGDIEGGCLVFGPYVATPFAGSLTGYAVVDAIVDKDNFPRTPDQVVRLPDGRTVNVPGAPLINDDSEMFRLDLIYRKSSGREEIGSKWIKLRDFENWSGNATPYSRCTRLTPCADDDDSIERRNFLVYANDGNHDVFGMNTRREIEGIEVRVCHLSPHLTSLRVIETVVELVY